METKYISVGNDDWGVVIVYGFDVEDEYVDLMAIMRSFGLSHKQASLALSILSNYNTGMCVSRDDIRMSCVFISEATSEDQWWDTLAHELLDHCQRSIVDYYGVDYVGEDSAWLTGYLMRKAVQEIGEPCY